MHRSLASTDVSASIGSRFARLARSGLRPGSIVPRLPGCMCTASLPLGLHSDHIQVIAGLDCTYRRCGSVHHALVLHLQPVLKRRRRRRVAVVRIVALELMPFRTVSGVSMLEVLRIDALMRARRARRPSRRISAVLVSGVAAVLSEVLRSDMLVEHAPMNARLGT